MSTTAIKYKHRHKLNTFLNGLLLVVNNYNVSGSIATTTKTVFKTKLLQSEFDDLVSNLLYKPKNITTTTITFQLNKLKVKITN